MTDQNLTEIVCILDKSGSMATVVSDTVGAYNAFIAEQKKVPGVARVSLVLFNTMVDPVYLCFPLPEVPELTTQVYRTMGGTALLDAIGTTINSVGDRLRGTPEEKRPGRVIVMIITDGQENSSHYFSRDAIKAKIEHQKERYHWQFLYLGADPSTFDEAVSIGIVRGHTMVYQNSARGMGVMGQTVSNYVSSSRAAPVGAVQMDWSNEARAQNDPNLAPVAGIIDTTKP